MAIVLFFIDQRAAIAERVFAADLHVGCHRQTLERALTAQSQTLHQHIGAAHAEVATVHLNVSAGILATFAEQDTAVQCAALDKHARTGIEGQIGAGRYRLRKGDIALGGNSAAVDVHAAERDQLIGQAEVGPCQQRLPPRGRGDDDIAVRSSGTLVEVQLEIGLAQDDLTQIDAIEVGVQSQFRLIDRTDQRAVSGHFAVDSQRPDTEGPVGIPVQAQTQLVALHLPNHIGLSGIAVKLALGDGDHALVHAAGQSEARTFAQQAIQLFHAGFQAAALTVEAEGPRCTRALCASADIAAEAAAGLRAERRDIAEVHITIEAETPQQVAAARTGQGQSRTAQVYIADKNGPIGQTRGG